MLKFDKSLIAFMGKDSIFISISSINGTVKTIVVVKKDAHNLLCK